MSVVAFAARPHPTANQPQKDLYEVGEIPPLGHVPKNMYAWVIRRDRHGPPEQSMQLEVVPTHAIGEDEVLVLVMAAGVNYIRNKNLTVRSEIRSDFAATGDPKPFDDNTKSTQFLWGTDVIIRF